MPTLEENVNRVKAAKTAIGNAITAKGGTVGANDGLEDFASDIATIPSGGGGANFVTREVDFVNNTTSIIEGSIAAVTTYGNMRRCNVANNGTINAFYGDRTYTEDGSNGQVMVYVPKFYYKIDVSQNGDLDGVNIRHGKWSISDSPKENYKLHPAFLASDGVSEIPFFLYSAFSCVGEDNNGNYNTSYNTTNYKLASVAGYTPVSNLLRNTARDMAANRGTGWYQVGVKQTMAIQLLMAVEYGFNSQKTIGLGVTSDTNAQNTGITFGNGTSGTQNNGITPVNYRGVENLWGNMFTMIDGIKIIYDDNSSPKIYVANGLNFNDNPSQNGYKRMNFVNVTNNYVTAFGYDESSDWFIFPSETSPTPDYDGAIGDNFGSPAPGLTRDTVNIACLGGGWAYMNLAGGFYWRCNSLSNARESYYGARIMYIPQL